MKSKELLLKQRQKLLEKGFTIVELLVVIVVIGILAAITIVSYTGITQRAIASLLQSDLANSSQQLKMFQVENGSFPTANNCSSPSASELCLKSSSGTIYNYQYSNSPNSQAFCVSATKSNQTYRVTQADIPSNGGCILSSGLAMHFDAVNNSVHASDTKITDLSGSGNSGTLTNNITFDNSEGGSMVFDGSGYISVENFLNQTPSNQSWTVGALVKLNSSASTNIQRLINFNNGVNLVQQGSDKLLLYLNGGTDDYYDYGNFNLRDGKWHVVFFVFQNSTGKREIYVDNVDVSITGPNFTSNPSGLLSTFKIGEGLVGKLNDVNIYNRALTAAEVQQNFNALRVRNEI